MNNRLPDLSQEVLLFDGAMGTMLQKTGVLKPGNAPELLNLTNPAIISDIHRSYIQAGSNCIETNTFGGNRIKLEAHGLSDDKIREVNFRGVKIAREAVRATGVLVVAALGPTGKMLEPLGDLTFDTAYEAFHEQCAVLAEAGADMVLVETMSDIQETKAAILAAFDVKLPVIAAVNFMENGRILTGHTPEMVAAVLSGFPLFALGTNCGMSASLIKPAVQKMLAYSRKYLIVQPNAGKPSLLGNETRYLESPSEYAQACLELVHSGVRIIGGCCGTTPEHIRLLKNLLDQEKVTYTGSPANEDYLVGKNSMINIAALKNEVTSWKIQLGPGEPLWQEICQGNPEPFIDNLLEIAPDQYKLLKLDGSGLSESDLQSFQELISIITTYWTNPICAQLESEVLIKALLTGTPGRSLVIGDSENNGLSEIISKYGGVLSDK